MPDIRYEQIQRKVLERAGIMVDGRVHENVKEIKPVPIRMLASDIVISVRNEIASIEF